MPLVKRSKPRKIDISTLVVAFAVFIVLGLEVFNVKLVRKIMHKTKIEQESVAYSISSLGKPSQNNVATQLKRSKTYGTTGTSRGKSVMIIATVPNDDELKFGSIWSQLECFANDFDEIHIVAPSKQSIPVNVFVNRVLEAMPELQGRLKKRFDKNIRYDSGLWCDVLTGGEKGGGLLQHAVGDSGEFLGGTSDYDRFMLINDSLMAVEKTNEFLEILDAQEANVVSLNYWGDKNNRTTYWIESALRVFDLEGVQIFADNICSLGQIKWKQMCPYLENYQYKGKPLKQCIVDKTEIEVVKYYPPGKIHGLYSGNDGESRSWTMNFENWVKLRKHESFPAVKNSRNRNGLYRKVRRNRRKDTERCTTKLTKYSIDV